MRILVSSSPGVGHLLPLLPVAREATARGHDVLVAVGAGLAPIVQAARLRHVPTGPATIEEGAATRPRIAVTLGTVNAHQIPVLRAIVEGVAATGAHVVVALGADPTTLGPVPTGVTAGAYVPMSTLLPAADLVAFHGGSGTMLAALAAARPMVIVPLAADQPDNAELCAAAGVARIVPLEDLTADAVQTAIDGLLTDPSHRLRAAQIATEIAAMPGPEDALARIERLVQSTS